jgi:hypothetical protein
MRLVEILEGRRQALRVKRSSEFVLCDPAAHLQNGRQRCIALVAVCWRDSVRSAGSGELAQSQRQAIGGARGNAASVGGGVVLVSVVSVSTGNLFDWVEAVEFIEGRSWALSVVSFASPSKRILIFGNPG